MPEPIRITEHGSQLSVLFDDGSKRFAYPTPGGFWIIKSDGGGPGPSGDYTWPLGAPWGWTTYEDGAGSHSAGALDFGTGGDTPPLFAAYAGEIIYAGFEPGGGGDVVVIKGPDGEGITYAHMSSIDVSVGQVMTLGQKVGNVGATGTATGNHLHLEVRVNGTVWGSWYRAYDYFLEKGIDLGPQVG